MGVNGNEMHSLRSIYIMINNLWEFGVKRIVCIGSVNKPLTELQYNKFILLFISGRDLAARVIFIPKFHKTPLLEYVLLSSLIRNIFTSVTTQIIGLVGGIHLQII